LSSPGLGPAFITAVLTPQVASDSTCAWVEKANYGTLLAALLYKNEKDHMPALNAVQTAFLAAGFPKSSTGTGIIDTVFTRLFALEILTDKAFFKWKDDHDSTLAGRTTAVIQTTKFMTWLEQEEEVGEDDE